jgi:hypothetical protein
VFVESTALFAGAGELKSLVQNAVNRILIESGGKCDIVDGKTRFAPTETDTPWVYVKFLPDSNCYLWAGVTQFIEKPFIHTGCQNCYKVVIKPQTFNEFWRWEGILEEMGRPSKLGIETRAYVKGLYGVYFYCRGLEEAREVQKNFPNSSRIKRGCTELENRFGPSDKWEVQSFQLELEYHLEKMVYSHKQPDQTKKEKAVVREKWKRFAWKYDPTYTGKEFYPETVEY